MVGSATQPLDATSAVGVDIGGTSLRAATVRADGSVGELRRVALPATAEGLVSATVTLIEELCAVEATRPVAVGVGCAGLVDRSGTVRTSPNIPALVNHPLQQDLTDRLGLPVRVDNDANAAAWAEYRVGAGQGATDMALVTLGTGIGTGFVLDGRLHRGRNGYAGESGHVTIVAGGLPCVCGRRGCWERYSSGTALGRLAREAAAAGRADAVLALADGDVDAVRGEHVAALVPQSEPGAMAILAELGHWTAVGLAGLVNVLDPGVVVIGGGLASIGQPLIAAIETGYRDVMVDHDRREPISLVAAAAAGDAGVIGAGLLALGR